ncbi:TetR family transcriptional regulator C-terminal domain-containing protein [Actinacidiphila sp. bgisy160]|uniref:TetR family transcriptional regulator C-terminal domain-containing protein n=1 Tax=Actinacidiphila sp. bgisy160 TaxID=3413796 RepID=UPI003D727682
MARLFGLPPLGDDGAAPRLAARVWSQALRNPVPAGRLGQGYARVVAGLVSYADELRRRGMLPEDAEPDEVARSLIGTVQGVMLQRALFPEADVTTFRGGPRALAGFTPEPGS